MCGLFNGVYAGRFSVFPWSNFSIHLPKQEIHFASVSCLSVREVTFEELTFQEYCKVTYFQNIAIKLSFPVENASWTHIKLFPERKNRRLFFLYNWLLKAIWPMLKKMEEPLFCAEKPPAFLLNPSSKETFLTASLVNTCLELFLSYTPATRWMLK